MNDFLIEAIDPVFDNLLALDADSLQQIGVQKIVVNEFPGFPCRVSLEDAAIGEEVLLLNFEHHKTDSPFKASGPIFIRKNISKAQPKKNEIPKLLEHRFLSLRCYTKNGSMLKASTCKGIDLKESLHHLFSNLQIEYIHIHNAGPGCYNCAAVRA